MGKRKRGLLPEMSVLHDILGPKGASPLHRMDPRTKILWFVLTFVTGLFILENIAALAAMFLYVIVLGSISRVSREQFVMMRVVVPLSIIVFAANLLLLPAAGGTRFDPVVDFGVKYPWYYLSQSFPDTPNIAITFESLYTGAVRGLVVLTLSSVAALFVLLTDLTELVEGMHLLRVPYKLAFTVGLAVNYIPILFYDLTTVSEAQRARGYRLDDGGGLRRIRSSFSLILPVINCAYTRTGRIADAMTSRGFGGPAARTPASEYRMTGTDYLFIAASAGVLACFIMIRLFFPLFEVNMNV